MFVSFFFDNYKKEKEILSLTKLLEKEEFDALITLLKRKK